MAKSKKTSSATRLIRKVVNALGKERVMKLAISKTRRRKKK